MRQWFNLVLLLPPLLLLLLWQNVGGVTVKPALLKGHDRLAGFDAAEEGYFGAFRWSISPEAKVNFPAGSLPGVLEVRGVVATGATIRVGVGDTLVVLPSGSAPMQVRKYALLIPVASDAIGWSELRIVAEPLAQIGNRRLGFGLFEVHVTPVTRSLLLPPPVVLLVLGGGPLLLALALWLSGLPQRFAVGSAAGLGLVFVTVWFMQPELVAPLLRDVQSFLDPLVVRWWLVSQAASMAGLPVVFLALRRFPLAGYPLAKVVGMLLVTLGAWTVAVAGLSPFNLPLVVAVWMVLLAGGWTAWMKLGRPTDDMRARISWRVLVGWELLFIAGLFAGVLLRWHGAVGPAAAGTEKPMELAFINAVLRYERFPPLDPWFAGFAINYYYLGYVLVGALALVTSTGAEFAFNLGFALIVALTVTGVAYFVVALVALTLDARKRGVMGASMLAIVLTLMAGNQAAAIQLLVGSHQAQALDAGQLIEAMVQRITGAGTLRLSRPTPSGWHGSSFDTIHVAAPGSFDWFRPSRSLYDDVVSSDGSVERRFAITEFPAFSLYLGDLHPHVLAMPVNLLVLTLSLGLIANSSSTVLTLLVGLHVGMLYGLNSWHAPTFALISAGALLIGHRRDGRMHWRRTVVMLAVLACTALLAALPFILTFSPPMMRREYAEDFSIPLIGRLAATFGLSANHTRLHHFLGMFGLFLVPILTLALRRTSSIIARSLLVSLPATLVIGVLIDFPLLFLLPLAVLLALGAWGAARHPADALTLWAGAVGAGALLVPEIVFIRDHLEGEMSRLNTIFKFYYQVWVIWGGIAAYALWRLLWIEPRRFRDLMWGVPAALLLAGALIYPLGLRWAEPWLPGERSFDGLAFLSREAPDELTVARWLAAAAAPEERVLSGFCNCDYELVGRLGAISGVQTLLGVLDGHERLWRSGRPEQMAEMAARERDIPAIYQATSFTDALALLRHYQISYVYFGPLERRLYGAASEEMFAAHLPLAFSSGSVRVYRVVGD